MAKIVLILVLLGIIFGGALAGLGVVGLGPLAAMAGEQPPAPPPASPSAAGEPRLVKMETVGVPLFAGNSVRSRLFLNIQLAVEPTISRRFSEMTPRLQDAFLTDLIAHMPDHLRDRDKVDVPVLQRRLLKVAQRVTGPEVIRAVTITHAFER